VLTPQVLERTYGAPMHVLEHGGMPIVVDAPELVTNSGARTPFRVTSSSWEAS
jgi:hypothetical protein